MELFLLGEPDRTQKFIHTLLVKQRGIGDIFGNIRSSDESDSKEFGHSVKVL